MACDDELRLNELRNFRKTTSRLMLEAYSHCEVPAGCGGIVLRWRRPGGPIGLKLFKYVAGAVGGFRIDGRAFREQRTEVEPGEHVLSFVVEHPGDAGFILLRVQLEPKVTTALHPIVVSHADGRWRASLTPPPKGWRRPGFDDSGFVVLVEKAVPKPKDDEAWSWKFLQEIATGLGLPSSSARSTKDSDSALGSPQVQRVWVRWAFRVDHQGFA